MADKQQFKIWFGYDGFTHHCVAETREKALLTYRNMKKMYPFCRLEEVR